MGFMINPNAYRRALAQGTGMSDQDAQNFADENAQAGDQALPPTPKDKGVKLTDTYADVPLHALVAVADAVDGLLFHAPSHALKTPVGRALAPLSPALGVVAAGGAAKQNIESTYDYNPKTNLAERRTANPTLGTVAISPKGAAVSAAATMSGPIGPMTSALLEKHLPENPGLTYLFSPRAKQTAEMAGEFTRQGLELKAAEVAAKRMLPQALQAMQITGDPAAKNVVGQVTKFLGATQSARINVGKILAESLAGMGAGAADSVTEDLVSSTDGSYNPGKTFKKAALTSLMFGGASMGIAAAVEGKAVINRELVKRALSNPEFIAKARTDIKVERVIREAMNEDFANPAKRFTPQLSVDVTAPDGMQVTGATTLGDFGGAINEEAKRAYANVKKLLESKKDQTVQFSAATLPEESARGLGALLRQLNPEDRARLRFDQKTRLALGVSEDIANPELKAMATGQETVRPILADSERKALVDSIGGLEKPTRFPKPDGGYKQAAELSDIELIQMGREQRSIEMQKAASADTVAPEGVLRPTPEKAYDAAKKNLASLRAIDKLKGNLLTFDDLSAVSGVPAERLSKMSNSGVRELRDKFSKELTGIMNQKVEANKLAQGVRGRGMTTPARAAQVTQTLQKHGVTVNEAAALLNADLNVSTSGPTKIYGNPVYPGDIMTFEPTGLDNLLQRSKPEIDRLRAAKRRYLAENPGVKPGTDIDQLVLDSLSSQKPSLEQPGIALTDAEKSVLKTRQGRRNPLKATDEEYLKEKIASGDESDVVGYPSDVVKVEPHSTHKVTTAEGESIPLDAHRDYNVSYTDSKGVEHFAILRGKQIIENDLAGVLKVHRVIDEREFMDPIDKQLADDLDGIYLGSGLGGGQKELTRMARNMRVKLEAMGVNVGDQFEKMDKDKFRDFILGASLPTHVMNVHPEFRHVFDAVLDKEGSVTSIRGNAERILNYDKDAISLKQQFPVAYSELNKTLRLFDLGAHAGKIPTELEFNQAIAGIASKAGNKGSAMLYKVVDQVGAIRAQARDLLAKQIREEVGFAKLSEPHQKIVDEFINGKLYTNPWYQPINRDGHIHVSVVEQGSMGPRVTHRESFETTNDALEAVKRIRESAPGKSVHMDNLKTKASEVWTPAGKKISKTNKGKPYGQDDGLVSIDDLGLAAENAAVPTISEDLKNIMTQQVHLQGMAVDQHLKPRDYTPGFRDDLVDDIIGGYRKIINNVSERYPSKVLENKRDTIIKMVNDSMATQFGPTRDALIRYANKYIDMATTSEKNPALGAGIRAGLYNWMLSYSGGFLVMNSLQTFQTSLRRAAGYGPTGLQHFFGSFASSEKFAYAMLSSEEKARGLIAKANLPQEHREILARLLNEGVIGDITTKQMVSDTEGMLTQKSKDNINKFLSIFARISEKHNRFQDALMYTGIGRDVVKLKGDDLYNFVRRGIMETQFGLTDSTLPLFMSSADTVNKSFWKANLMFYKFATESYSRQMEGIKNMLSGVEGTAGKNMFERADVRARAGKSRLQVPVDVASQLALGGITGLNVMSWASGIATGGRPGAAWVTEQGLRALGRAVNPAWAISQMNEKFNMDIPLDLSYDQMVKRVGEKLGGEDGKNFILHGLPNVGGFTFSNKIAPQLPDMMNKTQGSFIQNYKDNATTAAQKMQEGDMSGIARLAPTVVGNVANGLEIARTHEVYATIGRERELIKRDAGAASTMRAFMGLQDVDVFNAKRDYKIASDLEKRREQVINLVKKRITNEVKNSENPSDDFIDGTLDIARLWNANIRSHNAPANLVIDVDSRDSESLSGYYMSAYQKKASGQFNPQSLEDKTLTELNARDSKGRPKPVSTELAVRNYAATGENLFEDPKKRRLLDQQREPSRR